MIKVLIVDDEKAMLDGLTKYIPWNELGVEGVIATSDPLEAVSAAEKESPDILLADIKMPGMDGIEMGKLIRKKLPDCSIIFLTAYSEKEYLKSAILLRAVNFLEKPVNRAELSEVVSGLVTEIRQRKEKTDSDTYDAAAASSEEIALKLTGIMTREKYEQFIKKYNLYGYEDKSVVCANIRVSGKDSEEAVLRLDDKRKILIRLKGLFEGDTFTSFIALKESDQFVLFIAGEFSPKLIFNSQKTDAVKVAFAEYFSSNVEVFIGVGEIQTGLYGCSDSYQKAVIASQRYFFAGYDKIMFYSRIAVKKTSLDDISSGFEAILKQCDKPAAIAFIHNTAGKLKDDHNQTISSVKNLFYNLLLSLFKFAGAYSLSGDFDKDQLWDKISGIKTLGLLAAYAAEQIEAVMPQTLDYDIVFENVHKVVGFVESNYQDHELSLEKIARGVFLSPPYICKIFKEKIGKTVNTYIVETRMEKAKLLLRDNGTKLADIASMVGYRSPNHFAKIFNRYTGANPSDYRRRLNK